MKDFTPTKETISLHGLGFIQVVLPGNQRMHVWHPDLPRRDCYEHSAIHNHRFSFVSRVLKGVQKNVRVDLELARNGSHTIISHNGPRSSKGGRESYPVAGCNVHQAETEVYEPGQEYTMPMHQYHHTPNSGIVVTIIRKTAESTIHANSVIRKNVDFHYDFDRFQLTTDQLFGFVVEALRS
jgi:hypothetical protein